MQNTGIFKTLSNPTMTRGIGTFKYYAFGSAINEMQYKSDTGGSYRYGFNNKETDTETDLQDYGFRIYNPSICKFLSVDPLADDYPWYTPYQFAGNKPLRYIDLDGLEEADPIPESYWNNSKTHISMENAPNSSKVNVHGVKRNNVWYFNELFKRGPEMFSPENIKRIKANLNPIIDETWVKYNPSHKGFLNSKLVHHHINQGKIAAAIPETVHLNWNKVIHQFRGSSLKTNLGKTLNSFGTIMFLIDLYSNDPHSLGQQMEMINGICKLGEVYYDSNSDSYFVARKITKTYDSDGNIKSTTVTFDWYDYYYYDNKSGKYKGFDKQGTKTETYNHKTKKSNEYKAT
jgi:RHS repeat-associated protein